MARSIFPVRPMALLALAVLSGCAAPPAVPPVLSLDGRPCATGPELITAHPVPLDGGKETKVAVTTDIACMQAADGTRSSYVAFSLPTSPGRYLVTVKSVPMGQTLFTPRILLLDGLGKPVREVSHDVFMFHGDILYAGIQATPDERYLVVASDSSSIGQQVSQLAGSTQTNTYPVPGGGIFFMTTGSEATKMLTLAHNGSLIVSAGPLPKVN